ncbi:MAG: tRNA uridine-5-carboxymethylaminomethyl(34) synthesis GTPase MnmE [Candidatus Kapaibacterium sp.]
MSETIAALSTPPGISGLAVIRLSGPEAIEITDSIFTGKRNIYEAPTHSISYGRISDGGIEIDEVTISLFKAPNSYTGEDVIEIGCHGGPFVVKQILELLFKRGAIPAAPGEFTQRAFVNGRMDLTQVEAVADIIHSASVPGTQISARQLAGNFTGRLQELRKNLLDTASLLELELDFAEEDLEFVHKDKIKSSIMSTIEYCSSLAQSYRSSEILRSGYFIAIAGFPNSGKSTLFNALLKRNRAIVSEIPGTTRDYLEESLIIDGITINITDTAGIRESADVIEIQGIALVETILEQANMILIINDLNEGREKSNALYEEISNKYHNTYTILLQNKIDLAGTIPTDNLKHELFISAKTYAGLDSLRSRIKQEALSSAEGLKDVLINRRHADLLEKLIRELESAIQALDTEMENEIIAIDIKHATKTLGELTGDIWNEDVINNIFARFCIGK